MIEALMKNNSIIKANNSSYGNFIYNDKRYFYKVINKDDFLGEINGYLENHNILKVKDLINVYIEDDKYYLVYEYDSFIEKNKGLMNDLYTDYEYNKKTYDKNIFINIINRYRYSYRNLKILETSKNDCFFENRIKSKLINWYKNDSNFEKIVDINYMESTTTRNIINETINYFNNQKEKICFISGGDPNTFNLSTEGTFYDLVTAGYNNILGEVAITYISHLLSDAYFAPKYNKNSYINHDLIFKYIKKFKPKISFKNTNKIYIKSNLVTSSIRKKYIKDYLIMLKEENIPVSKDIKYYLVMRILCVFNIEKFSEIDYYYSLFLLHTIYNFIKDDAINSLMELLDYMDEI